MTSPARLRDAAQRLTHACRKDTTVTLTSVSGNRFSGNFDLVLDSGDHVTGSFDPEECPALNTALDNSMTSSCI